MNKIFFGDFPSGPVDKNPPFNTEASVWSLVGELRSHHNWRVQVAKQTNQKKKKKLQQKILSAETKTQQRQINIKKKNYWDAILLSLPYIVSMAACALNGKVE